MSALKLVYGVSNHSNILRYFFCFFAFLLFFVLNCICNAFFLCKHTIFHTFDRLPYEDTGFGSEWQTRLLDEYDSGNLVFNTTIIFDHWSPTNYGIFELKYVYQSTAFVIAEQISLLSLHLCVCVCVCVCVCLCVRATSNLDCSFFVFCFLLIFLDYTYIIGF